MNFKNNFYVFLVLLSRDFKILLANFKNILIDSIIHSSCFLLLYGYFLPTLGMQKNLSLPLFLGSVILTLVSTAYSRSVNIKADIEFKKFINYHLTLPISKNWLIAQYITAFIIELIFVSLPILIFGIIILDNFNVNKILFFLPIYLASLLFITILFLLIIFSTSWQWFMSSVWERILGPLIHLGCIFYMWYNLNQFSKILSYLLLLNPVTYISEGFRTSIVNSDVYLSPLICFSAIFIWSFFMIIFLYRSMNKFLDPV